MTMMNGLSPGVQVVVLLLYLGVLLGLYLVPLSITSPCIMERSELKPRPDVIGHQGAPMVSEPPANQKGPGKRVGIVCVCVCVCLHCMGMQYLWRQWETKP